MDSAFGRRLTSWCICNYSKIYIAARKQTESFEDHLWKSNLQETLVSEKKKKAENTIKV